MTARLLRAFALVVVWLTMAAALPPAIAADTIEPQRARIDPSTVGDGWVLSADFSLPLPSRLEETVDHGVPLYFVLEFELNRPRWYWWDEKAVQASQTYRLSYHALTRQYRLAVEGFAQSFASLPDALRALTRVRGWRVMDADQVRVGTEYQAQVRMRLDVSMMPKPFQVTAITNRDWNLQSEWMRFKFAP